MNNTAIKKYYKERIINVIHYIESNFQNSNIDLNTLAAEANFSQYHFSRVFSAFTGISPVKYLTETRLKESAYYLQQSNLPITEIAMLCGFGSISTFNDQFKKKYDCSPRQYREKKDSKNPAIHSNKPEDSPSEMLHNEDNSFLRSIWNMNVSIEQFPEYSIAYSRHRGSYLKTGENWAKLLRWVSNENLFASNPLFIGISHDDPAITEEAQCRHDACVTLPANFKKELDSESGISFGSIPQGRFATYVFYDTIDKLALCYHNLFTNWLPQSGEELEDRPCLEVNLNNPMEDPEHRSRVKVCIPLKQ